MRLIRSLLVLSFAGTTALAGGVASDPQPPAGADLVAVQLVRADGVREVRLVPGDAIPEGAIILANQPGVDGSNAATTAAQRAVTLRPIRKGLTVSRRGEEKPASTSAADQSGSGSGSAGGGGTRGTGGSGQGSPVMGTQGDEPGTASSWRPIGPRGGGLGDPPPTPTAFFTVDKQTGGGVLLKWFDPSTNTVESIIQRQSTETGGNWAATREYRVGPTARSFDDKPGAGVHRYRVAGVNRAGAAKFTDWVSIEIEASPPNPPTAFLIESMPPRLTWVDNSDNEQLFEIEREKSSGGQWGGAQNIAAEADATDLIDTPGAGVYRYRIRAVNALGASAFSNWLSYTVQETPPNAPSELSLVGFENGDQPRLSWKDNSGNEKLFELERQKQLGTAWGGLTSRTFGAEVVSAVDSPGKGTFRYRVRALNGAGSSAFTPYLQVTVADGLPNTPGSFAAVTTGGGTAVAASWQDTSSNESGFEVQREKRVDGAWSQGTTLTAAMNTTSLNDSPGTGDFRYRVRAVNASGPSGYSGWAELSLVAAPPGVPQEVLASDMGTRRALLSWIYEAGGVSGFDIERSPSFSTGTVSVDSTVRGYVDQCGPGTFSYRVRSVGAAGASSYSPWATVTVSETYPEAPSDLVVTDLGTQNQIRIVWHDNSTNETGFRVQRQTIQASGAWGNAVDLPNVGADVVQMIDTPAAGQHRYRVCATNSMGDSEWTLWVTASISTGWTPLVPSADTRVVYVSSSTGNDSNSGLTEGAPVKTIARGYSLMRHQKPDWLLLKSGDVWSEGLGHWRCSGRSATEPMVISSYGNGDRPRLNTPAAESGFYRQGGNASPATIDNLWIVGIAFVSTGYNGDQQNSGISFLGPGSNLLIEDCLIQGYKDNIVLVGSADAMVNNVTIRRCVIVDAFSKTGNGHSQGIFCGTVNGLNIIENVIDNNGWKENVAPATIFNHNLYIGNDNKNVVIRGNITSRASSHGLQARPGGVVEGNLFVRNPSAMFVATSASTVRGNVVLEGVDIAPDIVRGFGIDVLQVPTSPPTIVEDNIIANKLSPNIYSHALGIGYSPNDPTLPPPGTVIFRNNIVYNWKGNGFVSSSSNPAHYGSVSIVGNAFVEPTPVGRMMFHGPSSVDKSRFTHEGNVYNSVGPKPFEINGFSFTFDQWVAQSGETGAVTAPRNFASPSNTVSNYNATLGGPATFEAFIAECRKQSKRTWREEYTAAAVNAYIRDGFK